MHFLFSDTPTSYANVRIIFCDTEKSNWSYDSIRKQYFWHRFYSHQPDLNYDNPKVQEEMMNVARFWLKLGIDGFRADAVPYLYEREGFCFLSYHLHFLQLGTSCENLPETHQFFRRVRRMMETEFPGTVLLSEANMLAKDAVQYFGRGDEFQMSFNFPVMPRLCVPPSLLCLCTFLSFSSVSLLFDNQRFMCLKTETRDKLVQVLQDTPDIPPACQWFVFAAPSCL